MHILVPVHKVKGMQLIDENSKNLRLLQVAKDIVFYCFVLLPRTCEEVLFLNLVTLSQRSIKAPPPIMIYRNIFGIKEGAPGYSF
jgi:hypothetical protein